MFVRTLHFINIMTMCLLFVNRSFSIRSIGAWESFDHLGVCQRRNIGFPVYRHGSIVQDCYRNSLGTHMDAHKSRYFTKSVPYMGYLRCHLKHPFIRY